MMKKLLALLTVLCLFFAAVCMAEEENQVDVTLEGYDLAGGKLRVALMDEEDEFGALGMIGTPGQTIREMLENNGILSVEPVLEGDMFEGWMEVAVTVTVDEFGFEENEYSLVPDRCYMTEELLALPVPDHNVTYMAKWASVPAEEYFAPCEAETIVIPSITLISSEGSWRVATVEPGQTFGEVLEMDTVAAAAEAGKIFAGWTVYEYNVEDMESSETCVEEEGVLCFELFEGYHMVLRKYTVCHKLLSTEELSDVVCEASDHVVVANWMTAEDYMVFMKKQSDEIKTSLEQDLLTQTEMNLKSEELRDLWEDVLNVLLDEAKKILPEADWKNLTAEQKAWEAERIAAVEAAGKANEGGSLHALTVNSEAAACAEERVYMLYELMK